MKAVVQRTTRACVRVDGDVVSAIDSRGLCVLVGVGRDDSAAKSPQLADKLWRLRIFDDDDGVMNLAAADIDVPLLLVSQFTLYGDTTRGRRPSWTLAAPAAEAEPIFDAVVDALRALGASVVTGVFGAHMEVDLVNDGPVTLVLDV